MVIVSRRKEDIIVKHWPLFGLFRGFYELGFLERIADLVATLLELKSKSCYYVSFNDGVGADYSELKFFSFLRYVYVAETLGGLTSNNSVLIILNWQVYGGWCFFQLDLVLNLACKILSSGKMLIIFFRRRLCVCFNIAAYVKPLFL